MILPISISILGFDQAAISISILKNWWQYIANILIEQYIANFEQYIAEIEQYIDHFMVGEKIGLICIPDSYGAYVGEKVVCW